MATEEQTDVLVIGSGMGGLSAALYAAKKGFRIILCEKADQVGGTTATSAGMIWIPNSRQAREAGIDDSVEKAREYLANELGYMAVQDMVDAYLADCATALEVMETHTEVEFELITAPDYHPNQPGGMDGGRCLTALDYDGRKLGHDFRLVRPPNEQMLVLGGMMVAYGDLPSFLHPFRTIKDLAYVARRLLRYAADRFRYPRGTEITAGNALVARFLKSLKEVGVDVRTGMALGDLIEEDGRVTGAVLGRGSKNSTIRAAKGVILATGGFAASAELRKSFGGAKDHDNTLVPPENTGGGILAAQRLGAAIDWDQVNPAFWIPGSDWTGPDGKKVAIPYGFFERCKPGLIAVNSHGKRFVNESNSYHDIVSAIYDDRAAGGGTHYWVCDSPFIRRYGLGWLIRPWPYTLSYRKFVCSGYVSMGQGLDELARNTGIDPAGLAESVKRNNEYAVTGNDLDFERGTSAYNHAFGEPDHKPNPNIGPIKDGPFFALRIVPTSLGTTVGLRVDENSNVLNETGDPIGGLFVCGNDQGSLMRGTYPSGGITLGPAMVFAYKAVESIAAGATSDKLGGNDC